MKSLRRKRNRGKGKWRVWQSLIIEVLWFINPFLHYRWDLQRLREEQQLQKLRARQEKQILSLSGNKKDDASLLPNIEVCFIDLTAVLVLNVFSHCRVQHTWMLARKSQFPHLVGLFLAYLKPISLYRGWRRNTRSIETRNTCPPSDSCGGSGLWRQMKGHHTANIFILKSKDHPTLLPISELFC